jgi:murein tripeptide amidase MpaA
MMIRFPFLSLFLLAAVPPVLAFDPLEPVTYEEQMVVRATITQPRQLMQIAGLTESYWSHRVGLGEVDLQIKAGARDAFAQLGIDCQVLIPDLQKLIDEERAQIERAASQEDDNWYTTYHNLADINAYGLALVTASPTLASRVQVGNSLEGRPIWALKLSSPDAPGNPRASRPQLLFNGGQHAREWVTPPTAMHIAERLLTDYATDARVRAVMDRAEIIVVPIVNPDGYNHTWTTERLWRKNRRNNGDGSFGVDLNRNWSVGWGGNDGSSPNPASETYRGPSPFSEPETAAMRDFMTAQGRIRGSIDIHSYSQLILSPLGYTTNLPPEAAIFDQLNILLEQAVEAPFGSDYTAGPTATTIYIASGTASDWSYGALGGFGYGVECRDTGQFGFVLPADQILPNVRENYQMAMTFAEFILAPLRFTLLNGQPATITADTPITIDVSIADGAQTLDTASPRLLWRNSSFVPYTSAPMTLVSGRTFRASIAGQPCGRTFEYYVSASTTTGTTATSPDGAPATVYSAQIIGTPVASYVDACEVVGTWSVGAPGDNATSGIWSNGVPQATGAQPGADRSPVGTRCWVTDERAGSGIGTYDVDGGTTTLTSPRFSAVATPGDASVSYWRWYSNNQGSRPNTNSMPVSISNNDGTTWTTLETASDNAGAWTFKSFRVADFVTPTANMRLRFVARDLTGAIVEAAIDDVRCEIAGCPSDPADFNGDGFVDFFDYDDFVQCFETNICPPGKTADFNNDGFTDFFDYDAYVLAFEG